jgi:aminoglycoside phosphotransferase (APT) family kinase protein
VTHDLGPVPDRPEIDVDVVRRLVATQFPQWAGLEIRPVAHGGWDNRTFHLGDTMSVRLPSAAAYAEAVDKEQRWLPVLAPQLPLPIPVPLGRGEPGEGYPYGWSVLRWLPGETASVDRIADQARFAGDLAAFLAALQRADPAGGPGPGQHNWFRGGSLRTFDDQVPPDEPAPVREIWQAALDATWDGGPRWFHGDVAPGNLLLDAGGDLAAVIDFGTCGVGDPACDLAVAWTLLDADGRRVFRDRLAVDDATWARGRGWALWKTLADGADPRILGEIRTEYAGD